MTEIFFCISFSFDNQWKEISLEKKIIEMARYSFQS